MVAVWWGSTVAYREKNEIDEMPKTGNYVWTMTSPTEFVSGLIGTKVGTMEHVGTLFDQHFRSRSTFQRRVQAYMSKNNVQTEFQRKVQKCTDKHNFQVNEEFVHGIPEPMPISTVGHFAHAQVEWLNYGTPAEFEEHNWPEFWTLRDTHQVANSKAPEEDACSDDGLIAFIAKKKPQVKGAVAKVRWIIDSGSGAHLISKRVAELCGGIDKESFCTFHTAAGKTQSLGTARVYVPELEGWVIAHVLSKADSSSRGDIRNCPDRSL
jgi:hypothetical protein